MTNGQEEKDTTAVIETETDGLGLDAFNAGEPEPEVTPETQPVAEVAQTSTEKPQWDKERQRADQAEANYRKAKAAEEALNAKLEAVNSRAQELESKLNEFAKANNINLDEIDADLTDPKLIKAFKQMQEQVELANKRVEQVEQDRKQAKELEKRRELESKFEAEKQEIIADIEAEFPARFRNEAIKAANKICSDRGYDPSDRFEAYKILRDCYKQLASKPAASTPKPVATDTGKSTASATPDKGDVSPGSLREVAAQLRRKAGL